MIRDKRWEKVYASIQTPQFTGEGLVSGMATLLEQCLEFSIRVPYGKTQFYSTQRVHKDDFLYAQPGVDFYKMILDYMVERIDEMLDEHDSIMEEGPL